jgi:hypothetical protein
MRNPFRKSTPITRQLVPQDQRSIVISQLFGFSFDLESIVRGFILSMAKDYRPVLTPLQKRGYLPLYPY